MNRDLDHNFAASSGIEEAKGGFYLVSSSYFAKLLFIIELRREDGVSFRPADLARGHPGPTPKVPREMALIRKTSRLGNFRQRSMCVPQHVFHMFQALPQQIRVRRHPH